MKKTDKQKAILWTCGIVGVLAVVALNHWYNARDVKLITWADKYEQCVKNEYQTTPVDWHTSNGFYPPCQTK